MRKGVLCLVVLFLLLLQSSDKVGEAQNKQAIIPSAFEFRPISASTNGKFLYQRCQPLGHVEFRLFFGSTNVVLQCCYRSIYPSLRAALA
jgi:hypothetical protein